MSCRDKNGDSIKGKREAGREREREREREMRREDIQERETGKNTGPKLRFPTCSVFHNVIFPHISYI